MLLRVVRRTVLMRMTTLVVVAALFVVVDACLRDAPQSQALPPSDRNKRLSPRPEHPSIHQPMQMSSTQALENIQYTILCNTTMYYNILCYSILTVVVPVLY